MTPTRTCEGCGQDTDQHLIYPHPAGGWWHTDFCTPPPDWTPPRNNQPTGETE